MTGRPFRSSGSDGGGHRPVLLAESLELLAVRPGVLYVDGTLGLGGHAVEVLRQSAPDGRLLGIDRDGESLERARAALLSFGSRVRLVRGDYREIPMLLGGERAAGILLDLGINSAQLDTPERGFSFQAPGPLDMRMDRSQGETAEEVVNRMPERALADLLFRFGEEPSSRRIARAIVEARRRARIKTTTALAEIVLRSVGRSRRPRLHPATRTFQALRIRVNRELEALGPTLEKLAFCLAPGGRLAVIAFHSLEDREVKGSFRSLLTQGFRGLTRRPVRPSAGEVRENPRARSARLRAIEREAA